jgi:hypothetical protein
MSLALKRKRTDIPVIKGLFAHTNVALAHYGNPIGTFVSDGMINLVGCQT